MELNIDIQNFGKISSAKIAVRPFTVITGCNSSGKSFITRGLYSIIYTLNQDIVSVHLRNKILILEQFLFQLSEKISRQSQRDEQLIDEFSNTLYLLKQGIAQKFDFLALLKSSDLLLSFIPEVQELRDCLNKLGAQLRVGKGTKFRSAEKEYNLLSQELESLYNSLQNWANVYAKSLEDELRRAFSENFQLSNIAGLISGNEYSLFKFGDNEAIVRIPSDGNIEFHISHTLLNDTQGLKNVVYLESPVYFKIRNVLKDSRLISVNMFRRGAVNPVPKYFYDLDELLSANLPEVSAEFQKIADKIEKAINGNLVVTPRGDIVYEENGKPPVSLHMASSGISNMGMIALLLRRNVLDVGSFFFIDEPEMNLHTTWQHIMLDVLLDLSNAGVNVVIATHSLDMLHRLEFVVENMSFEEAKQKISINRLTVDGYSERCSENILLDINKAKQILGAPYIEIMKKRLPK